MRNWNKKNSIYPDSTLNNLRTWNGRKLFAKEKRNGYWEGICGTGIKKTAYARTVP
jgi:hypothetical protein